MLSKLYPISEGLGIAGGANMPGISGRLVNVRGYAHTELLKLLPCIIPTEYELQYYNP